MHLATTQVDVRTCCPSPSNQNNGSCASKDAALALPLKHAPCTVAGLSVAEIDSVQTNSVTFRGADVVDGTPVLDIKPYIPYVDGGVAATAPSWVLAPCPLHLSVCTKSVSSSACSNLGGCLGMRVA